MKTFASLIALAIATSPTNVAHAAPLSATQSDVRKSVTYDDLDISTRKGQRALEHRIDRAVTRICLEAIGGSPAPPPRDRTCFVETKKEAMAKMKLAIAKVDSERMVASTSAEPRR